MLNSFLTSFRIKNTYRVNSIIYSIKQFPIIKNILPDSLYQSEGLKIFGNIISAFMELASIFIGKILYILLMIFVALGFYKTRQSETFLHIFTFLTITGALCNTYMFNPTKDKYYAMMLLNMDAKKYTISNYYYNILKVIIGFLPFTIIFGTLVKLPLWICFLLPIFVAIAKMIINAFYLCKYEKDKKAINENEITKTKWVIIAILVAVAYVLPFVNVTINTTIFLVIFAISIILGILSFYKINKFNEYKKVYKQILVPEKVYLMQNQREMQSQAVKDMSLKKIELDTNFTSNKQGYAFFHEIFVKRHKKILTEAVKKQAAVILTILAVILIGTKLNQEVSNKLNSILLTYLPYFVFIMYLINRGPTVTQAMFMNCDHSMLTFRVYRTPKVILGLFKERLKTLIKINLLPASIIAIGLPMLLWITGGTDNPLNYAVLFTSILSMSIFFSVHYLAMYYLLQPYNVNTEMKSSTFKVVQIITYFVCYYMIQIKLPTISFGITMIVFCLLYCVISLIMAYKFAPKTFKLRI